MVAITVVTNTWTWLTMLLGNTVKKQKKQNCNSISIIPKQHWYLVVTVISYSLHMCCIVVTISCFSFPQYREERFRMTSESTNQRVLWWSIAQTIILIITGIWQMRHLKSFFEAKKLVWKSESITKTITQVTFIAILYLKHGNTQCFISIFCF